MKDRDCQNCIWHDVYCRSWDCEFMSYEEAKERLKEAEQRKDDE